MATNGFKVKNSINLQPGAAPANPLRGDIYCSSADGKFYRYDDSVPGWVELGSGGGAGATVTVSQTGHGFATDGSYIGKPIRNSGVANTYVLAKADTSENAEVVGILTAVADANSFSYSTSGEITGLSGLTPNTVSFLSGDTAGSTTTTAPTTAGYIEKPLLIATASNKAIFVNMRGTTVGGTNLYTTIPLNNGTATTILNLSDDTMFPVGSCGELTGGECNILQTGVNTDYIFGFKVLWAKTASNVVNIQPDAMADVPPGFAFGTSGANIQVSFTALANFESGKVRYAMNAAPIGAQLPLQIASSRITWSEPTMFRNRIINGGFDIWQRGDGANMSAPINAGEYVSADRWKIVGHSASVSYGHANLSKVTTSLPDGVTFAAKLSPAAATADNIRMGQYIESANSTSLVNKPVTISMLVKRLAIWDINTPLTIELWTLNTKDTGVQYLDNPATGAPNATIVATYDHMLTTAGWETVKFTTSNLPAGATNGLLLRINYNKVDMGLGEAFAVANVQLEPGTIATPFEFRPYGTELALCQRYLPSFSGSTFGFAGTTSTAFFAANFQVVARVKPTSIAYPAGTVVGDFSLSSQTAGGQTTALTLPNPVYNNTQSVTLQGTVAGTPFTQNTQAGLPIIFYTNYKTILFEGCEL